MIAPHNPKRFPRTIGRAIRLLLRCSCALAMAIAGPIACQSTGDDPQNGSLRETGQQVFGNKNSPARGGPGSHAAGSWSIMTAAYTGPDQAREARNSLAILQSLGFTDAFAQQRGKATIVAVGTYPSYDDPKAKEDLGHLREFVVEGERPYARAWLVPPENAAVGAAAGGPVSELDLRNAPTKYGRAAIFTLQVGVYARPDQGEPSAEDLAKFQAAAEEAAAKLRRDGDEAFFYHGPFRSMVTVGVFDYSDSDRGAGKPESMRLTETRQRHPYNLLNGAPYRAKRSGPTAPGGAKPDDYVKSDLVEIPQK